MAIEAADPAADLTARFSHHPPRPEQVPVYEEIRARGKELAAWLTGVAPASRELSLAVTHLEQAVMWANAAVARRS
jgi:hypothetical protein